MGVCVFNEALYLKYKSNTQARMKIGMWKFGSTEKNPACTTKCGYLYKITLQKKKIGIIVEYSLFAVVQR